MLYRHKDRQTDSVVFQKKKALIMILPWYELVPLVRIWEEARESLVHNFIIIGIIVILEMSTMLQI